jgi:cyclophilin family peptidyl-prolyl cis-trans isomerase/protein-disulfide isomerase
MWHFQSKRGAIGLLAAGLLVAACRPAAGTPAAKPPAPAATPTTRVVALAPSPTASATSRPPQPPASAAPAVSPVPSLPPTLAPSPSPALPGITDISATDWVTGPVPARVTIIEYSDYQCAPCARLAGVLLQIRQEFPDDVRWVHRHFPGIWITDTGQPLHDKSELATEAAEAAGAQGKFWAMHIALFRHYAEWAAVTPAEFRSLLTAYAQEAGLDGQQFAADLDSHKYAPQVQAALVSAANDSVGSAPVVFFNGAPYQGDREHWAFAALIKLEKFKDRQFSAPPPQVIDPLRQYSATLHTTRGDIVFDLFADKAQYNVNNFVFLARQGWYNNIAFHTVVTDHVQTGDPTDTGFGLPGYFIPDEFDPSLKFDAPGWVGMANSGPDTNGCQFFITRLPMPQLDGKYTLIGKVTQGLEVLARLAPRNTDDNHEAPPGDMIISTTIQEK